MNQELIDGILADFTGYLQECKEVNDNTAYPHMQQLIDRIVHKIDTPECRQMVSFLLTVMGMDEKDIQGN